MGAIHSTKISGNFGPKLNGSVLSNQKSFEKTGPPFEVDQFSRSDRLEFWLNGSRPLFPNGPIRRNLTSNSKHYVPMGWRRPLMSHIIQRMPRKWRHQIFIVFKALSCGWVNLKTIENRNKIDEGGEGACVHKLERGQLH